MSKCKFARNHADIGGGAIGYQRSNLYINSSVFENNTAAMNGGGAINANDQCKLMMNDSIAIGN